MAGKLRPGSVITVPATGDTAHRCVIVADDEANGDWLVIPICSFHNNKSDASLIIETSFFPNLVVHRSYVAYYMAKKITKSKSWDHRCDLPADKLELVRAGISASDETEPWFEDEYKKLTAPPKKGRILRREDGN